VSSQVVEKRYTRKDGVGACREAGYASSVEVGRRGVGGRRALSALGSGRAGEEESDEK